MESKSDELIFYTEDGSDCVKGYFKVLAEPEESSDSSVVWTAEMKVVGKEVGELKAHYYLHTADDDDRRIFGTMMRCRAGDRVYLDGQIWAGHRGDTSRKLLIVDDIASDNPYDTATREYPADPEYWEEYPGKFVLHRAKKKKNGEPRYIFIGEVDSVCYQGAMTIRHGNCRLLTAWKAGTKAKNYFKKKKEDMDGNWNPGCRRLNGSRPTAGGPEISEIRKNGNESKVRAPERKKFMVAVDPNKFFMVHNSDAVEFFRELEEKGEKYVQRRLTKEGLEFEFGGWIYTPPGHLK